MAQWYRQGLAKAMNKEMDWDSDAWKLTLHTATYAPNLDTHAYVSDLTNELTTAGNYTAGGFALTMIAPAYTAANSWATTRANTTAYALGNIVRPASANGFLYQAVVAGTTGAARPPTRRWSVGKSPTAPSSGPTSAPASSCSTPTTSRRRRSRRARSGTG
jgi:hypothetical protein